MARVIIDILGISELKWSYLYQDYITIMYPELRTVSGLNLLANPVILKCKLWE